LATPHLGVGPADKVDQACPQVLLKGAPGQSGAGRQFLADLIRDAADGDGLRHSTTILLPLSKFRNERMYLTDAGVSCGSRSHTTTSLPLGLT
jgi:hypothetical protein